MDDSGPRGREQAETAPDYQRSKWCLVARATFAPDEAERDQAQHQRGPRALRRHASQGLPTKAVFIAARVLGELPCTVGPPQRPRTGLEQSKPFDQACKMT